MNLAWITTSGLYFVHADRLGTPQMLTDGTGAVVWDANYAPFGEARVTGSVAFNLRFPGQYFDDETGLHYNMMRDYDAALGRYVQSDPIGLAGGWNTYAYVGGNPVMATDRSGLVARGQWIGNSPTIGNFDYKIHDVSLIVPEWTWWGYVNFVSVLAEGFGTISVDVRCLDEECGGYEWEKHYKIPITTGVHDFHFGPNLYAAMAGALTGDWRASVGLNVTIILAKGAYVSYVLYDKYYTKAMYIRAYLLAYGPSAICNKGLPPLPIQ